ncbi:MAG: hypothetical protein LBL82_00050 [Oscillospiraceae bacterium]|nr:hypothetical protein [Oscillospiraceae bacterium]
MNKEQLVSYILARVKDGKQREAQKLIDEVIARQERGGLNQAYIMSITPAAISLIKPQYLNDVRKAISNFKG